MRQSRRMFSSIKKKIKTKSNENEHKNIARIIDYLIVTRKNQEITHDNFFITRIERLSSSLKLRRRSKKENWFVLWATTSSHPTVYSGTRSPVHAGIQRKSMMSPIRAWYLVQGNAWFAWKAHCRRSGGLAERTIWSVGSSPYPVIAAGTRASSRTGSHEDPGNPPLAIEHFQPIECFL